MSLTLSLGCRGRIGSARAAPAGRSALGPTRSMWLSHSRASDGSESGASEPESESPLAARARIRGLLPILPARQQGEFLSHLEFLCLRKPSMLEKDLPQPGHAVRFSWRPACRPGPPDPESDSDTGGDSEPGLGPGKLGKSAFRTLALTDWEGLSLRGMEPDGGRMDESRLCRCLCRAQPLFLF